MFCDLVDSTGLAERMDAEELRDLMSAYQRCCRDIIETARGNIAQLFGDGVLALFGFPIAHEDDARRAVFAGLDIREAVPGINHKLKLPHAGDLAVRIGLHTGVIVIDEAIPGPASQQNGLVGGALNISARLQALSPRNGIIISQDTYELVQGHFHVERREPCTVAGVSAPLHTYRVLRPNKVQNVFEARLTRGLSPMVGRATEQAALDRDWTDLAGPVIRSVLLVGEAGIGKSRLLHEFRRRHRDSLTHLVTCHCAMQFQNTAFHPIATELARLFSLAPADTKAETLLKIAAALAEFGIDAPVMAERLGLLYDADRAAAPLEDDSGLAAAAERARATRRDLVGALISFFGAMTGQERLLIIFEDIHWADPSTLEFLRQYCRGTSPDPVLVLCSARPAELDFDADHVIALERIPPGECAALLAAIIDIQALPSGTVSELLDRSDGVPLYLEELTRSVSESLLERGRAGSRFTQPVVPSSLHDSIMSRLDRLGAAKEVAQIASLIGRSFHVDLLRKVVGSSRRTLEYELEKLIAAEIFVDWRAGAETSAGFLQFRHELVRNAACESMLRSQRRSVHAQIAEILSRDFADQSARNPEILGHHYAQSGDSARALPLLELAGQRAVRNSASAEAVAHFLSAIELLPDIADETARLTKELDLHIGLAAPLMATKGYAAPEYDRTLARAMEVAGKTAGVSRISPLIYGRWSFDQVTGNIGCARVLAAQYLTIAERSDDAETRLIAYRLSGTSLQINGQAEEAARLLGNAITLFDDEAHAPLAYLYGADIKVMSLCSLALAYWGLAREEDADRTMEMAWERTCTLRHVVTTAYCGAYRMTLRKLLDRDMGFDALLAANSALLEQHDLPIWRAVAPSYAGWFRLRRGDPLEAVRLLQQAISAMESMGFVYYRQLVWAYLGEAFGVLGRYDEAETAFEHAQALTDQSGQFWSDRKLAGLRSAMRAKARAHVPAIE